METPNDSVNADDLIIKEAFTEKNWNEIQSQDFQSNV
jgi:hypothetical protein